MRSPADTFVSFSVATAVVTAIGIGTAPAIAQTSQQLEWCNGKEGPSLDQQVTGCTALIKSGKYSGHNLAIVFNNRGTAYDKKGDFDRAIVDYDQAIRLDPNYAVA